MMSDSLRAMQMSIMMTAEIEMMVMNAFMIEPPQMLFVLAFDFAIVPNCRKPEFDTVPISNL